MSLKDQILEDTKTAMRAKDKERLAVLRLVGAALKQKEVDERITLTDEQILTILEKMIKQRREAVVQYEQGNRPELAEREQFEINVIQTYLPEQLGEAEIDAFITEALQTSGATSVKDMGKVMGVLMPKLKGRADMKLVGEKVKAKLAEIA